MKLLKFSSTDGNIVVDAEKIQAIGVDSEYPNSNSCMIYLENKLSFEIYGNFEEVVRNWKLTLGIEGDI